MILIHVYISHMMHLCTIYFLGYNATVFAYVQTGSVKSYTMGRCYEVNPGREKGVIPRVIQDLFDRLEEKPDYNFSVKVSHLEVKISYRKLVSLYFNSV